MYERFTDRARRAMMLSQEAAMSLNHNYIGTEHLLIGLLKEGTGVHSSVLKELGVDPAAVLARVNGIVQPEPYCPGGSGGGKLPQTPGAKRVIELSLEWARVLVHNYVGTEHLLLGLVAQEDGVAAKVLTENGLTAEKVKAAIIGLLGETNKAVDCSVVASLLEARKAIDKALLFLAGLKVEHASWAVEVAIPSKEKQ